MTHAHPTYDTNKRVVINGVTRMMAISDANKPVLIQYDNNSEVVTFEVDRYVEGHDLSLSNKAEVHYNNLDLPARRSSKGLYEATDLRVDPDNKAKVLVSWYISNKATMYEGTLNFVLSFSCLEDDVYNVYRWNSHIGTFMVSAGINNSEYLENTYADVLEMWRETLFGIGDTEEARILAVGEEQRDAIIAKGNDIVALASEQVEAMKDAVDRINNSIPSDYNKLQNEVKNLSTAFDAITLKLPLECTTHTGDSSSTVISVTGDGFNNLLEWNTTGTNYIYASAHIGKWGDYANHVLYVAVRNESDNDLALNGLQIVLSGARNWGDIYKSEFISVGDLAYGETKIIELDISNLKINANSSGDYFADDSSLFLLIADQTTKNESMCNNNNKVRFFCACDDSDKMFTTVGYTVSSKYAEEAFHSVNSDNAVAAETAEISKFANESGYHVFKDDGFRVYANAQGSEHCHTTYSEDGYSVKFDFAELTDMEPNSTDTNGVPRFWTYTIASFDIASLFGKNAKIVVEYEYDGDEVNDLTTYQMCYYVGPSYGAWSNVYLYRGFASGNTFKIVFDLDNMDWNVAPDTSNPVYLGIGYDFISRPDENGLCHTPTASAVNVRIYYTIADERVVATELDGFDPANYYTKDEVDSKYGHGEYITCWGDSLTAGTSWVARLGELTGMTVYNGGTGGENVKTIVARQGADAMTVNNITIPASASTPLVLATMTNDKGITTEFGNQVTPMLQGGAHVNPCKIGDVVGTLRWTGSSYSDTTGTWTFTRTADGDAVTINRPTALRTDFDMNKNKPYLMVIFMGQNGGYSDVDDLINWHRLMIEHANATHVIVLGLSSGTKTDRADYEAAMKKAFGRYFISLREYLSSPIYDDNSTIVNCYGLDDQGLTPTSDDLTAIASGKVPASCLTDSVHYTSGTKTVIGDLIYKKCRELNIF